MEKLYINIGILADTFTQKIYNFSSRLHLYIRELLIDLGAAAVANVAADALEFLQIGNVSRAARGPINIDTPIVLTANQALTPIGMINRTIHFVPKDPIRVQLSDDGNLYIGVQGHDATTITGWISYTKNEPNNPKKYVR